MRQPPAGSGGSQAIDDPPSVDDLLAREDLEQLIERAGLAADAAVAILSREGHVLVARPGEVPTGSEEVRYGGEVIATVVCGGERGPAVARLLAQAVEIAVYYAHRSRLTSVTHDAAMHEAYNDLSQKHQRLENVVRQLEDVDRVKSNFLATMSHELRTPLTSVIGYSEMLLEGLAGPVTDGQRDYLHTILGKSDQLLQLITALLDLSTLESRTADVESTEVEMKELLSSVVSSFQPQAHKRGIVIEVRSEPLRALGDRRRIRQVVWSLVSNAVKFSPDRGRVTVEVKAGLMIPPEMGTTARNRWGLHLVVTDRGIGISREQIAQIFEPFFQVDSSSTREYGGSGLGLTLAKAYVEAHGGRLWVDSVPGEGSTFTASLPAVAEDVLAARDARGGAS